MIVCPYQCGTVDEGKNLLVCRPKGILSSELAQDIFVCQHCLATSGLFHLNRFHDLSGITGIELRFQDIMVLAEQEQESRKGLPLVEACYFAPNDALYGIARMYRAMIEGRGARVHVSRDLRELATVLKVDEGRLRPDG